MKIQRRSSFKAARTSSACRSAGRRFSLPELLEARMMLSATTYTVTSNLDSGTGSLREAIGFVNADTDPTAVDTIDFNLGGSGPTTISLSSALPNLIHAVVINGLDETSLTRVQLNGLGAGATANGLTIDAAGVVVNDLSVGGFGGAGVVLEAGGSDTLSGDYIGVDPTGATATHNGTGVSILSGHNQLTGNVISGNSADGVDLTGDGNTLAGNFIGADSTGEVAIGNGGAGVVVDTATNTLIGGATPAARNVISANDQDGVIFTNDTGAGNLVEGNYIGVDSTGLQPLGNLDAGINIGTQNGLAVAHLGIFNNVISANGSNGIFIKQGTLITIQGNWIGTDGTGHAGPFDSNLLTFAFENGGDGVFLYTGSTGNVIGGAGAAANILSGNFGSGVHSDSGPGNSNSVDGNLIGIDISHAFDGNGGSGVEVDSGSLTVAGNTISDNFGDGVFLPSGADPSTITGNYIGTDTSGINLGNDGDGVHVLSNGNTIGGASAGQANAIAFNGFVSSNGFGLSQGVGDGVFVETGTGNAIRGNSIYSNYTLGIELGYASSTHTPVLNDSKGHAGANNLQDFPVIMSASLSGTTLTVTGTMPGSSGMYTLDFFSDSLSTADPSGYGEGQTFLGSGTAAGGGTFSFSLNNMPAGQNFITATATDANGNTSEFGLNVLAVSSSVSPASPTLVTTASFKSSNVVGSAIPEDTAVLSGGNNESGFITFTLTAPNGNIVDTETVTPSGDGSYSTSNAIAATQVGTYTWKASFAGDNLNNGAQDQGGSAEQVTTVKASPTLGTQASETAGGVVGNSMLGDQATFGGGFNVGGGTITFTLTQPDGTTVPEGVVTATGAGPFNSPTVLATEVGTYTWHATYNGDAFNVGASDTGLNESVTTVKASPTILTTPGGTVLIGSGAKLTDSATLAAGYNETGTIVFNLYAPSDTTYSHPLDTETVMVSGNGTYATPTGYLPATAGTYEWVATYNGDANNNSVADVKGSEPEVANAPVAGSISGTVYCDDNLNGVFDAGDDGLAGAVVSLTDSSGHTVTTVTDPNGFYTFGGLMAGTYKVAVTTPASGHAAELSHGTVTIPAAPISQSVAAGQAAAGPNFPEISPGGLSGFIWDDANNDGKIDWNEVGVPNVVVSLNGTDIYGHSISVSMTTDDNGEYVFDNLTPGTYTISDTLPSGITQGKLSLGNSGGTIASASQVNCGSNSGNCSRGYLSCGGYYSNDCGGGSNNCGGGSNQCGSSQQVFSNIPIGGCSDYGAGYSFGTTGGALSCGSTATIGFWHTCNGQNLLDSLNGSSHSTALGQWLATMWPNLYGVGAKVSLANMTNQQIASYYNLNDFAITTQKLNTQILAAAFSCYVTSSKLAGSNCAASYGFHVDTDGSGYDTIGVGSNGAAFNVANNTTISIFQALDATNNDVVNTVLYGGSASLDNMALIIYTAINQGGNIS